MRTSLPKTATPPFGSSEIRGSVSFDPKADFARNIFRFLGPGFLVAVGYMDPGNWATDIAAGSHFGYALLFVVLLSSLAAIVLQCLSLRLGIATGKDLAQLSGFGRPQTIRIFLWLMAEISIIACDLAEVLGGALAFHLLLGVPLLFGIVLTIFDTLIVLGLKGRNFRTLEAIILALIVTVGFCYGIELFLVKPFWPDVIAGFAPSLLTLRQPGAIPIAVGIIGATVMPHNLYLHSSIILTRKVADTAYAKRQAIRLSTLDTVFSLLVAMLINGAILILAAAAFHVGGQNVTEIEDAYHLLNPLVGSALAAPLFAIALLAAGQSSTFTGTVAGQIIMEGFIELKIPCWQRRLLTRSLALLPAFIGVGLMGDHGIGRMLIISQIVLSLQLPFAMYPLIRLTSSRKVMGVFATPWIGAALTWIIFATIVVANLWLLLQLGFSS